MKSSIQATFLAFVVLCAAQAQFENLPSCAVRVNKLPQALTDAKTRNRALPPYQPTVIWTLNAFVRTSLSFRASRAA